MTIQRMNKTQWPVLKDEAKVLFEDAYEEGFSVLITIGLEYANTRTCNKPISVDEARDFINEGGYWFDIYADKETGIVKIQALSGNDMF